MTTIKSCTDLSQSRKLAEILSFESADMCWQYQKDRWVGDPYYKEFPQFEHVTDKRDIPCWSLAALLGVLPNCTDIVKEEADTENEKYMCTVGIKDDIIATFSNNSIDACYEMILKLNELKML